MKAAEALGQMAAGLRFDDLPREVVHKAKQLLLDSLGCALGGYRSEPSRIVQETVHALGGRPEATIIGSGEKTSAANAALANCTMLRYLDFMDIYFNKDGCHPSENIPTALAVAEAEGLSGRDALVGIVLGFEVQQRFADAIPLHLLQWHHVTSGGYATPVAAGRLMGCNADQIANAVGIAGCHNHALADLLGEWWDGAGHISMMKAVGYGFASHSGIVAAMMAKRGFTGPLNIIESLNKVVGKSGDLTPVIEGAGHYRILDTSLKSYPAEYLSQSSLEALAELRREHALKASDIASIDVDVHLYVFILAREGAYRPQTREAADHSLPYCLAMLLIDGELTPRQFEGERWADPQVQGLMDRIKFHRNEALDALYPPARPIEMTVRTHDGRTLTRRIDYPHGDPHNPMSDAEIEAKFRRLGSDLLSESALDRLAQAVWSFDTAVKAGELVALTRAAA